MKKLFGEINMTWLKIIIFAIIAGVYTGVVAMIPAAKDTSFQDIAISFEWWILFAIIIIMNSKSPLDSALKTFIFFLVSQPLVYLVQVPFNSQGWGIFGYYKGWFIWTLLTFPMAFIGHFMKKDKWWGLVILLPMIGMLAIHYEGFLGEALVFFPNHLLSAIFCAATMIIYPLFIFDNKKIKIAGLIISLLTLLVMSAFVVIFDAESHEYSTELLSSGVDSISGVEYDDSYKVYLGDPEYGDVSIVYDDGIQDYIVKASFRKVGSTTITLESPEGEKYVYDINIERSSYDVKRRE